MRERYGDIFTLARRAARQPWVLLADPEAVKQVFTGDPDVLQAGAAHHPRALLGATRVLLLDEPEHMRQRKRCCRRSTASACSATAT